MLPPQFTEAAAKADGADAIAFSGEFARAVSANVAHMSLLQFRRRAAWPDYRLGGMAEITVTSAIEAAQFQNRREERLE